MVEEKKAYSGYVSMKYAFVGILAIVYGIINYMIVAMGWQAHTAWIVGGIILLLIAWAKQSAMKS